MKLILIVALALTSFSTPSIADNKFFYRHYAKPGSPYAPSEPGSEEDNKGVNFVSIPVLGYSEATPFGNSSNINVYGNGEFGADANFAFFVKGFKSPPSVSTNLSLTSQSFDDVSSYSDAFGIDLSDTYMFSGAVSLTHSDGLNNGRISFVAEGKSLSTNINIPRHDVDHGPLSISAVNWPNLVDFPLLVERYHQQTGINTRNMIFTPKLSISGGVPPYRFRLITTGRPVFSEGLTESVVQSGIDLEARAAKTAEREFGYIFTPQFNLAGSSSNCWDMQSYPVSGGEGAVAEGGYRIEVSDSVGATATSATMTIRHQPDGYSCSVAGYGSALNPFLLVSGQEWNNHGL